MGAIIVIGIIVVGIVIQKIRESWAESEASQMVLLDKIKKGK